MKLSGVGGSKGPPGGQFIAVLTLILFSPMVKIKGERIPVLTPHGPIAYHASPEEARQLLRARLAQPLGTKYTSWAVQLLTGPSRPVAGTKYSHNHETEENPRNVFALRNILHLDRSMFNQVQASVMLCSPA